MYLAPFATFRVTITPQIELAHEFLVRRARVGCCGGGAFLAVDAFGDGDGGGEGGEG